MAGSGIFVAASRPCCRGARSASFGYRGSPMANSSETDSAARSDVRQGSDAWHLWRVIMPRRSIAGRLVWGMVWRRNRGGRWQYKKFVEYSDDGDPKPVSWTEAQAPAGQLDIISRAAGHLLKTGHRAKTPR
jgi:hypothetical protein